MKEQAGYVPTDDLEREEDVQETDERENFVAGKGDDNLPGDGTSDDEDSQVSSEQDKDGSVIPLQYLGVSNTELNEVSMDERMKYALANQQDSEGGYIVRHGVKPLSEFGTGRGDRTAPTENPLAATYPVLFPYGIGGIEAKRERKVGFEEHVRWALQYHDQRFWTHHSFPFVTFAIVQKREALLSVHIQMNRRDFERDAQAIQSLTVKDLKEAENEEALHMPISNPRVKTLRKHLFTSSGRVTGSDKM
ncbi:hypothetical protein L210DRAFT_3644628 [Boletus edulis BED1]|uniref:Uncharacterized protein n=1 Tax=Boletus edulis BED1 TaxID=1328754 RepID=A0AAD4BVG9_BOLED|nr:hypothetical protein L210DRAFT_3644628 [Boletus edulis BED1]